MTDHNPYDFLSGDEEPSRNGVAAPAVAEVESENQTGELAEPSDFSDSPYSALEDADSTAQLTAHAPQGAIAREDSVAALAAREAYESEDEADTPLHDTNGRADYESSYDYLSKTEEDTAYETGSELVAMADGGDAPPPIDSERAILQPQEPIDPNAPNDKEQDIWSHLGELRSRMLKAIMAVVITSAVAWNYVKDVQDFLLLPVLSTLDKYKIKSELTVTEPMQAFTTYFQLALVAGVIAAAPVVLWQMWSFIAPALTKTEKRFSGFLLPFSIGLFFLGCALGYFTSPLFFNFFLAFVPPGVAVMWTYTSVVTLLGKMLLVFGVCFQVPVVTIFLNKTGIVSRNWLIEYWRHVVVVIFIVVAVLTPTWDPVTLAVCAVPPCLLYALSIWLIKWL
ncbi:MAG TPA: twin-arginine translocase subunit TatC [Abditibacteriaceae bacterium]|jgi:sec-independent protein translocase protein TatC